ncbi:unnamed protein product [Rotaria sp. Silwood2]|nr:unnamed protein product [Rotaria sp. Silwood2]CAF3418827.1 unnamed protein product [Rotaria sp. Silwood2]CAF4053767.1 unnamed protein product [Rotaria sp. Silwood2]CAF4661312.1 unnamed protein product [Rotaria sp. Silwood2]
MSLYTNSPDVTAFTLMFHEIKTCFYKARNYSYPSASQTLNDVKIERIWRKTLTGQDFIFMNSLHPIFGTIESLRQLSACDNDH